MATIAEDDNNSNPIHKQNFEDGESIEGNMKKKSELALSNEIADVDKEEEDDREDLERRLAEGEHPSQNAWIFWFNRRVQGARSQENYAKNIKRVGGFNTIEGFWSFYNHLIRPNDLPNTSDYHLFKKGNKTHVGG